MTIIRTTLLLQRRRNINLLACCATIAIITCGVALAFPSLTILVTDQDGIDELLIRLGLITFFVERSTEGITDLYRAPMRGKYEAKLNYLQENPSATLEPSKTQREQIFQVQQELQAYKYGTQKVALMIGFFMGLMLSLIGLRAISPLLGTANSPLQQSLLLCVDMFVTAGIIAGGSEGLHTGTSLITQLATQAKSVLNAPRQNLNQNPKVDR